MLVPMYHITVSSHRKQSSPKCHPGQPASGLRIEIWVPWIQKRTNNDFAVTFIAPTTNTVSYFMDCNIFCSVQNVPSSSGKSSEATSGGGPSSIKPTKQEILIHKLHIHQITPFITISRTPMTDVCQFSEHRHLYHCVILYTNYLPILFVYY